MATAQQSKCLFRNDSGADLGSGEGPGRSRPSPVAVASQAEGAKGQTTWWHRRPTRTPPGKRGSPTTRQVCRLCRDLPQTAFEEVRPVPGAWSASRKERLNRTFLRSSPSQRRIGVHQTAAWEGLVHATAAPRPGLLRRPAQFADLFQALANSLFDAAIGWEVVLPAG
jgi:hypothetical protein